MGASQLDALLSSVADDLDVRFELDGEARDLHEFTGVVHVDDDGRAGSTGEGTGPDEWPYLAWDVATFGDEAAIELHADSGAIHTHEPSYLARELAAGRYRPAIEGEDGVTVATLVRPDSGTDDRPSDPDDHGDGTDAGSDEWFGADGDAATGDEDDDGVSSPGVDDDADGSGGADTGAAGDWPGTDVGTGRSSGSGVEVGTDLATPEEDTGSDDGSWPDVTGAADEAPGDPSTSSPSSAGDAHAGEPTTDEGHGTGRQPGAGSGNDGDDGDGTSDPAGTGAVGTGGPSGEQEASSEPTDGGTGDAAGGVGEAPPGADPEPGAGRDRGDGSSDRAADRTPSSEAASGRESESEVERLLRVATDRTQWGSIRQNAIRQLPDHGREGADALAEIAEAPELPAEDRELAEELLGTVRSDEGDQPGTDRSDPLDF